MSRFPGSASANISGLWIAVVLVAATSVMGFMVATAAIDRATEPLMALHGTDSTPGDGSTTGRNGDSSGVDGSADDGGGATRSRRGALADTSTLPKLVPVKGISGNAQKEALRVQRMESAVAGAFEQGLCAYADQVVWDNPTAYWRFSTPTSESGQVADTMNTFLAVAKPGVLFGMPSAVGCTSDYSVGFLATRQPFVIAKAAGRAFLGSDNGAFAVELWARPLKISAPIGSAPGDDRKKKIRRQAVLASQTTGDLSTKHAPTHNKRGFSIHLEETADDVTWVGICRTQGGGKVSIRGAVSNYGMWYHLVMSFDGTNMRFAVNGISSVRFAECVMPQGMDFVFIGTSVASGPYFQGDIDEVAIYNHALSWDRIEKHRQAAQPPNVRVAQARNAKSRSQLRSVTSNQEREETELAMKMRRPRDLDGSSRRFGPRRKD